MSQRPDALIIHYGEIALKSGNRLFFEKKLAERINAILGPCGVGRAELVRGKLIAKLDRDADLAAIKDRIKFCFGVVRGLFAVTVPPELAKISDTAIELVRSAPGESFKIDASRQNKKFPLNSMEIGREIGSAVNLATEKRVDVRAPQITCEIQVGEKNAHLSVDVFRGPGGLPVGTQKDVLVMLSGGIDSPVAALRLARRGATVSGVHFHSYPQTSRASLEKVKELASIAGAAQGGMKITLVPFLDIQKEIVKTASAELRVILYRRSMFRLAERLARTSGALALGTGESLGQVASQTLENMAVINEAARIPVLRPLLAFDKDETIAEARRYGTYEISIRPHDDCCSLFSPDRPETRAKLAAVLQAETSITGLPQLENAAFDAAEKLKIEPCF